ncbi:hypothetical protein PX701_05155 [Agromyces sp. H3Y2-19a]|uniref:hypothetical protein n=1 Tax=Agromyces chromiiresistens TaxID=3030835 RepID=UPI0023B969BA|nr:hypothetical protein [Agromyces chromiiresistens]MDF0513004.1 hypothetical protein [Agromyces chromiiresistens]
MPGIDVIAGIAIIATFVIVSVATADTGVLEQRMRRRGSVGEAAEAIRHAQDVMDYARGGYLGVVCTPTRRMRLSGDLEPATIPPDEAAPEVRAVAEAPAVVAEVRPERTARHLAPRHASPRRRLARGFRVLVGPRHRGTTRSLRPAERRARATTRPRAGTR